jgi:HEAT repeat protein
MRCDMRTWAGAGLLLALAYMAGPGPVRAGGGLDDLREFLKNPDPTVQIRAIAQIEKLGASAKAAIPDLAKLLMASGLGLPAEKAIEYETVRGRAATALGRLGAVKELTDALDHKESPVVTSALGGLRFAGAKAKPSLPKIRTFLKVSANRIAAILAIGWIEPEDPTWLLHLTTLVNDPQTTDQDRKIAVSELGYMNVKEAVPLLRDCLKKVEVREAAAVSLGRMGPTAKDAVPDLIAMLNPDRPVQGRLLPLLGAALASIKTSAGRPYPEAEAALRRAFSAVSRRMTAAITNGGQPDPQDRNFNQILGPILNALLPPDGGESGGGVPAGAEVAKGQTLPDLLKERARLQKKVYEYEEEVIRWEAEVRENPKLLTAPIALRGARESLNRYRTELQIIDTRIKRLQRDGPRP